MSNLSSKTTKFLGAIALAGALLGLGAGQASAQVTSGDVTFSGTVAAVCEMTLVNNALTNLDLVNGQTDVVVGTFDETCNDPDGYEVNVFSQEASTNTGTERLANGSGDFVSYTLEYKIGAGADTDVPFAASGNFLVIDTTGQATGGTVTSLLVTFAGSGSLPAGTYADTLTVSITGK